MQSIFLSSSQFKNCLIDGDVTLLPCRQLGKAFHRIMLQQFDSKTRIILQHESHDVFTSNSSCWHLYSPSKISYIPLITTFTFSSRPFGLVTGAILSSTSTVFEDLETIHAILRDSFTQILPHHYHPPDALQITFPQVYFHPK